LLDTSIMILRSWIAPEELPDEMAISAVTLAELSAGPHEVRPDTEQDVYFDAAERARRPDVLQRAERPIPMIRRPGSLVTAIPVIRPEFRMNANPLGKSGTRI
jgi:predicted nucleic acid-binding protein